MSHMSYLCAHTHKQFTYEETQNNNVYRKVLFIDNNVFNVVYNVLRLLLSDLKHVFLLSLHICTLSHIIIL